MSTWNIQQIPSFCITLERRLDRWKRFQNQSGIHSLPLKRFIGVDGKTIDVKKDERVATLTKRNIITKSRRSHEELDSIGGIGCALSHIAIWQWMVDNNQEICLIFEDDAIVPPDFVEHTNQLIKSSPLLQKPTNWDIWLLGGKWDDISSIPNETKKSSIMRIGSFMLFHSYIITLSTAKKLLKDVYPIHCHIDIWVSIYSYLHDLRIVGSTDLVLEQSQRVKTDIQSEEGCLICNVPTKYEKKYSMIPTIEWRIAQVAEVVSLGLIAFLVYQHYSKK